MRLLIAGFTALLMSAADVPRPAPDLSYKLPDGRQINLGDYRGKVVAIEFLITTCPHCQRCSQIMQKLYGEMGARGFQPLGVAINEMAHMLVPDYVRDLKLTFPVGFSDRGTATGFLQHPEHLILSMPQVVFIDRKGVIRAQVGGADKFFLDEEKNMRAQLESLLK